METIAVLIFLGIFAIPFVISYLVANREEKEEELFRVKQEKEHLEKERLKREREEAEEERKRNTMCCICGKCSRGYTICNQCYKRAEPIKEELPKGKIKDYLTTLNFHKETINNIIDAKSQEEKEYYGLHLIITSDILEDKYFLPDAWHNTHQFLSDLTREGPRFSQKFIDKYYTKDLKKTSESHEANDYSKSETPFHCKDGHNVRSKAEREIDNFLYENQVWHIYEYKYEHPVTKEWALPDFYLPDYNLYIEYFGLNTEEYLKKRARKIKMYSSDPNIKFAYLTYEDDGDIYGKLRNIFHTHGIPLK